VKTSYRDRVWKATALAAVFGLIATWCGGLSPAQDKATEPGSLLERFEEHLEWHKTLERNIVWAAPGMIIAFDGPATEADALARDGWVVCDGRPIKDPDVDPRFQGKSAPRLQGHFLKGDVTSGKPSGSPTATTSVSGEHAHRFPIGWYHRPLSDGNRHGIDTRDSHMSETLTTQAAGNHSHTVAIDPPAFSVIYLMYVRTLASHGPRPTPKPGSPGQ
jgi:hypothetical protein